MDSVPAVITISHPSSFPATWRFIPKRMSFNDVQPGTFLMIANQPCRVMTHKNTNNVEKTVVGISLINSEKCTETYKSDGITYSFDIDYEDQ